MKNESFLDRTLWPYGRLLGVLTQAMRVGDVADDQARIGAVWTDPNLATLASAVTFSTRTGGGAITEKMRVDGSGNVGMGTTSPSELLEVRKDQSGSYTRISINNADAGKGASLALKQGTTRNAVLFYENAADILHLTNENGGAGGPIYFGASGDAFASEMVLLSNGNLGIGTAAPGYRLHTLVSSTCRG